MVRAGPGCRKDGGRPVPALLLAGADCPVLADPERTIFRLCVLRSGVRPFFPELTVTGECLLPAMPGPTPGLYLAGTWEILKEIGPLEDHLPAGLPGDQQLQIRIAGHSLVTHPDTGISQVVLDLSRKTSGMTGLAFVGVSHAGHTDYLDRIIRFREGEVVDGTS